MSTKPDYYDVLGVDRTASSEEIRKAFRDLARRHHPDVSKESDAESRFKQINEAYEVLGDSEKRSNYDQFGHSGPGSPFGVGFDDFGGIGDVFDAFFGGGRGSRGQAVQSGEDARVVIDLEFWMRCSEPRSIFRTDVWSRAEPAVVWVLLLGRVRPLVRVVGVVVKCNGHNARYSDSLSTWWHVIHVEVRVKLWRVNARIAQGIDSCGLKPREV